MDNVSKKVICLSILCWAFLNVCVWVSKWWLQKEYKLGNAHTGKCVIDSMSVLPISRLPTLDNFITAHLLLFILITRAAKCKLKIQVIPNWTLSFPLFAGFYIFNSFMLLTLIRDPFQKNYFLVLWCVVMCFFGRLDDIWCSYGSTIIKQAITVSWTVFSVHTQSPFAKTVPCFISTTMFIPTLNI